MRFVTLLLLLPPSYFALRWLIAEVSGAEQPISLFLINVVLSRLIVFAILSWVVTLICGARAQKFIGDGWLGLFRLILDLLLATGRLIVRLISGVATRK